MNTADKQTSNLSSDFHNSNSANFSERKFARDYDKDPLVITDYSNFIDFTLCGASFFCAMSLFLFAINYFDNRSNSFFTCFSPVLIALTFTLLTYVFSMVVYRREIKFTNRYIEFIRKGKVERRYYVTKDHNMIRPFFVGDNKGSDLGDKAFIFVCLAGMTFIFNGSILLLGLAYYLSNLAIKFLLYLILNGSFWGFTAFPFIKLGTKYLGFRARRYFLIYFYGEKIYDEVGEYFLQKDIYIDEIEKSYSF